MTDSNEPVAESMTDAAETPMSPMARAIAVFANPGNAWVGLKEKAQWWFPLMIMLVVSVGVTLLLHNRALVPMMIESWDQQVADGQMQESQVDGMIEFFESPAGMAVTAAQQAIGTPIMMLIVALVVWFGVGFVLGTKLPFRQAFEVATWSSLITIPAYLITTVLAWVRETMQGIHVGFGGLLPPMDEPTKFGVAIRSFLDALGPLSIWYLIVGIIGAAALSGAPRKSVAWVLGILYLAIAIFMSALAAMFAPGG